MRILVLSRTPWNNSNSFGNTFSNLFGGMGDVEIYNICCQSGCTNNDIVIKTLQMSEASVLRSLRGGDICISSSMKIDVEREKKINDTARMHKSTLLLMARDTLWTIGAYKWKKAVKAFICEVKPDIVYLPIYASPYMCSLGYFVVKCAQVPVIGHISDDIWNYPPSCLHLSFAHLYKTWLRRQEVRLIETMAYLEVFSQNMKDEYEAVFKKPCFLIGKGVDKDNVALPQPLHCKDDKLHFVYTGGIGGERFEVLIGLGTALERSVDVVLDIYSATPLSAEMKRQLQMVNTIVYHGAVNGDEVLRIQQDGDYLVHVEGFSKDAVFSAKMSFSTKIIDCLSTGNVMFAIGPAGINSIQVLQRHNMGVVVDDMDALDCVLEALLAGKIDTVRMQQNAYDYLTKERLKANIQEGMKARLCNLVLKNRTSNRNSI